MRDTPSKKGTTKKTAAYPADPDDVVAFDKEIRGLFQEARRILEEHITMFGIPKSDDTHAAISLLHELQNLVALYTDCEWKTYPKRVKSDYKEYRKVMCGDTIHIGKAREYPIAAKAIVDRKKQGLADIPVVSHIALRAAATLRRAGDDTLEAKLKDLKRSVSKSPEKRTRDQLYDSSEQGQKRKKQGHDLDSVTNNIAANSQETKDQKAFEENEYHREIGNLHAKLERDEKMWPVNQLKDLKLEETEEFKESSLRGDVEEACIRGFNSKINHDTMQKGCCAVCFELAFKVKIFDGSENYLEPVSLEVAIPKLRHLMLEGIWRKDVSPFVRTGVFEGLTGT